MGKSKIAKSKKPSAFKSIPSFKPKVKPNLSVSSVTLKPEEQVKYIEELFLGGGTMEGMDGRQQIRMAVFTNNDVIKVMEFDCLCSYKDIDGRQVIVLDPNSTAKTRMYGRRGDNIAGPSG